MKLHKTIELNKNNFRILKFEEKYSEKFADYKFSGPDYYVNFELLISPNFDNNVKIFYDDSQDSEEAIPFISEGIEKFFTFLNSKNIRLTNRLNFTVTNTQNHPVGFKPKMFVAFTFKRLKKIIF